jgi:hypothetical protein
LNNNHLTNENYILISAYNYDVGISHSTEEFYEDLKRLGYIKKLLTQFEDGKELKERLILNHLIVLNNVFGSIHLNILLYLKIKEQFSYLKPFLIFLNILQDKIYNVNNEELIYTDLIPINKEIVERLRNI